MGFWDFLNFDFLPDDDAPLTNFQYYMITALFTVCFFCILAGSYLLHGGGRNSNNNKNPKRD